MAIGFGRPSEGNGVVDHKNLAEIRLTQHQISLYGMIMQSSPSQVGLRLVTAPLMDGLLTAGMPVELVQNQLNSFHSAAASLVNLQGPDILLSLVEELKPTQRRATTRVDCEIPAQYRAIRTDGRMGAWQDGIIADLSVGGVKMVLPPRVEVPKRMEILFFLPHETTAGKSTARMYQDDGSCILSAGETDRPLRATARAAHCRPMSDGRLQVGIAFSVIAGADKERIARFVEAV